MRRRTLLAFVGTGLAGCSGRPPGAETGSPQQPTAATTSTTSDRNGTDHYALVRRVVGESVDVLGGTVAVENPRVRKSVVVDQHTSPVAMHRGTQFVVVDVSHSLDDPPRGSRFRAMLDGDPAAGTSVAVRTTDHDGLTVAAPAPARAVDEAGIAWVRGLPDSVVWSLPASVGEHLGREPVFTVHDVSRVEGGDLVRFDVENTGDRGGTFNAVVRNTDAHDAYDVVSFDVSAGDRRTESVAPAVDVDPDRRPSLVVEWGTGSTRLGTD